MAAEIGEVRVVTLGGKGSSLSSSSVYAIATGRARVRIDSSALDRLSNNDDSPSLSQIRIPVPSYSSPVEVRAAITLLLNKLIHYSNSTKIRKSLPTRISESLNADPAVPVFDPVLISEEERLLLEKSTAEVYGICALLDYEATALITVADAVAALSCEASKADVSIFNSMDSGDGFVHKERIGVASDLKVLLNGSKSAGKVQSEAIVEIPSVHGKLREVVKAVHSMTRVELNCGVELTNGGAIKAVGATVNSLAVALWKLGDSSLGRAKMNLEAVGVEDLKTALQQMFVEKCPSKDVLRSAFKLISDLLIEEDYGKFVHEVKALLSSVWSIVAWEGITAFVALEGGELINPAGTVGGEVNGSDVKGEKKSDKKKKKKVVLGKGTSLIVQLIKEGLQSEGVDSSQLLAILVGQISLLFDPTKPEFEGVVNRVKDIVESNESRRLPKIPKGTRDFAKDKMAIRERAFAIITDVFKRHGATSLDTPVFELKETLMGKYGEDSKLIYDLADQGGELCSLRYDLTVPFARYVAMHGITSFKRYQIAKVYRRDNPSKGRFREFYQCDFDIAGQYEEMGPDFEIVKILTELLDGLDIGDYEVKLNHRKLLDGMLEICGVPPEKFRTICSSIDKLDKQSFDQVKKEMVEEKGLSIEVAEKIGTYVKERGSPKELLLKLKTEHGSFLENPSSKRALDELEILFEALDKSKCIGKVVFDLSLARGLDYYTGVIFEAVFKGTTQVGSIGAGGRYDNLIGMFGTKQVPAVGVSLGIERVFTIMEQIQEERNQTIRPTETQVLVSILGNKSKLPVAAELVSELWDAKLKAEYVVSTRFSKHIDRAKESKIPWMILVGDKELEKGIVILKNLETTTEEEVSRSNIVEKLRSRLSI